MHALTFIAAVYYFFKCIFSPLVADPFRLEQNAQLFNYRQENLALMSDVWVEAEMDSLQFFLTDWGVISNFAFLVMVFFLHNFHLRKSEWKQRWATFLVRSFAIHPLHLLSIMLIKVYKWPEARESMALRPQPFVLFTDIYLCFSNVKSAQLWKEFCHFKKW